LAFIDDEQARLLNSVTVEPHDVLLNITGASVARCFVIDPRYLPARVNQHVAIIRPCADLLPKYLHQILINPDYKAQLLALAAGSLSREAITKGQIEEFKIPVPNLSIQTKLVAQVEALEKQIAQAQAVIDGAAARKQAILQKHL
jgi:restriction endonuclease S subunit